ncbi:MAG TPA: cbb3-type cytochrome c oxidase subunit 3 [Rickettsiales bacterium]|nr:cbb3-type cytochrome c oxidase subunit 3 [Rickettsiales bacterium]
MINSIINHAPTIATIGFFVAFCIIVFIVLRKKNKKKFEDYSKIPMDDDKK